MGGGVECERGPLAVHTITLGRLRNSSKKRKSPRTPEGSRETILLDMAKLQA